VWSRGGDCRALAETLAGDRAIRAGSDLARSCIDAGATLLVTRRLTSFDLCGVAVPHGFVADAVLSVAVAIGGGPHSILASLVAERIAGRLGVPGRAVYGRNALEPDGRAGRVLADVLEEAPRLVGDIVEVPNPAALVDGFPAGTLLIVGAPGGSWFHRQFFGPGARIRSRAPSGTIVVRSAPSRAYQVMAPPTALGPDMRAADAAVVSPAGAIFVAEDGLLLGTVDRAVVELAGSNAELRDLMEPPVSLTADEPIEHVVELLAGEPDRRVPVVDADSRLLGIVSARTLRRRLPG